MANKKEVLPRGLKDNRDSGLLNCVIQALYSITDLRDSFMNTEMNEKGSTKITSRLRTLFVSLKVSSKAAGSEEIGDCLRSAGVYSDDPRVFWDNLIGSLEEEFGSNAGVVADLFTGVSRECGTCEHGHVHVRGESNFKALTLQMESSLRASLEAWGRVSVTKTCQICNVCKLFAPTKVGMQLVTFPRILVLHLEWPEKHKNIKWRDIIPEEMDMEQFLQETERTKKGKPQQDMVTSEDEMPNSSTVKYEGLPYELFAAFRNTRDGHCYVYIKNHATWYRFENEAVSKVNSFADLSVECPTNVFLLLYRRIARPNQSDLCQNTYKDSSMPEHVTLEWNNLTQESQTVKPGSCYGKHQDTCNLSLCVEEPIPRGQESSIGSQKEHVKIQTDVGRELLPEPHEHHTETLDQNTDPDKRPDVSYVCDDVAEGQCGQPPNMQHNEKVSLFDETLDRNTEDRNTDLDEQSDVSEVHYTAAKDPCGHPSGSHSAQFSEQNSVNMQQKKEKVSSVDETLDRNTDPDDQLDVVEVCDVVLEDPSGQPPAGESALFAQQNSVKIQQKEKVPHLEENDVAEQNNVPDGVKTSSQNGNSLQGKPPVEAEVSESNGSSYEDQSVDQKSVPPHPVKLSSRLEDIPCGLRNQGATCYMNSLMQALYMTPELRNGIYRVTADQPGPTLCELQHLFTQLWARPRVTDTHGITQCLGSNVYMERDVQEFWHELFEVLEKDLQDTIEANLIQQLYRGEMKDHLNYEVCDHQESRTFGYLDIPLVVKGHATIQDSLKAFVEAQPLSNKDRPYCGKCNDKRDAKKRLLFTQFPPILVLQLMRFEIDMSTGRRQKVNDKMEFPMELDLSDIAESAGADFVVHESLAKGKEENQHRYELYAILLHSGSTSSGHYSAYIKSIASKQWFCFNDSSVYKIKNTDINNAFGGTRFGGLFDGIFSKPSAYMLMYRSKCLTQVEEFTDERVYPTYAAKQPTNEGKLKSTQRNTAPKPLQAGDQLKSESFPVRSDNPGQMLEQLEQGSITDKLDPILSQQVYVHMPLNLVDGQTGSAQGSVEPMSGPEVQTEKTVEQEGSREGQTEITVNPDGPTEVQTENRAQQEGSTEDQPEQAIKEEGPTELEPPHTNDGPRDRQSVLTREQFELTEEQPEPVILRRLKISEEQTSPTKDLREPTLRQTGSTAAEKRSCEQDPDIERQKKKRCDGDPGQGPKLDSSLGTEFVKSTKQSCTQSVPSTSMMSQNPVINQDSQQHCPADGGDTTELEERIANMSIAR